MNYLVRQTSTMVLSLLFFSNLNSNIPIQKLNNYNINSGYHDCNSNTNGELEVINFFIPHEGVIFDVGANVGDWSKLAHKFHPKISIFAFEPLPQVQEILIKNLTHCDANIFPVAISNQAGFSDFTVYTNANDCSSLYDREVLHHHPHINITVPTISIDAFCKEHIINKIDFLKIDTEGNEFKVLMGSQEMLKSGSIDRIQFEYGGCYLDSHTKLEDVYKMLINFGFKIYRITKNSLIYINKWDARLENYTYSNYLAILNNNTVKSLNE